MADWDAAESAYSHDLVARAAAGPPATLGEIWRANWHATALDTLTGSGQPLEDSFNKLVDVATTRLGPLPAAARAAGLDWNGARGFAGKALVIGQLAAGLSDDQRKELEPLLDFRARAAETAAKLERDAADVNGRSYGLSGAATGWLAGVSRQMVDPVNLALLPAGGGEGGILLSTAKMAGIAGVAQAVQEPVIQRNRGELGLEAGFGQAAGDVGNVVAGTAALGLGLPLLFRGAAYVARKAFARPGESAPPPTLSPEILDAARGLVGNLQVGPDVLAAARGLVGRLESEAGQALPVLDTRAVHLLAEEAGLRERDVHLANNLGPVSAGAQDAAELLARVQEVERQAAAATGADRRALLDRRDELLAGTNPDKLAELAAPLEQRRMVEAERASIAERLAAIGEEQAKRKAEQLGAQPAMLGQRMRVPHASLDVLHSVAPGDLEAAALVADRDVVVGPHAVGADAAAARAERGEPLPPREGAAELRQFLQLLRGGEEPPARVADLPFPKEEKTAAPPPPPAPPRKGEGSVGTEQAAAAKPLGNPQLAADAERALADAGGDLRVTLEDAAGGVREISARDAFAALKEDAAAAEELVACLGGIAEGEL